MAKNPVQEAQKNSSDRRCTFALSTSTRQASDCRKNKVTHKSKEIKRSLGPGILGPIPLDRPKSKIDSSSVKAQEGTQAQLHQTSQHSTHPQQPIRTSQEDKKFSGYSEPKRLSSFYEIHKLVGPCLCSSLESHVTILLISWGFHRDLRVVLKLGPAARVFVVDSRRSIHLHNLSDLNDRVLVLLTDDDERHADLAYDFDVFKLENESFQLHLETGDNDESDGEDGSHREEEKEEEEAGHRDNDDGDGNRPSKRRKVEDGVKVFKKLKRDYYRMGTFHGKPSGCLLFDLSHLLRRNTNELLWLACVSLTDQFVHERLTDV